MGINAYRTCHNPPAPELLDACDSLGILVLDETRLLNSGPEYIHQFENMILRDRNHPSIFLWSIGNEEGYIQTSETGKHIAETFLARQHQLDPTRKSTYAADVANVFTGINEVIPIRGFNYRHVAVADYHKSHPGQPILGTEMGSTVTTRGIYEKDTIHCYVPDEDITAPWWASKAEVWWTLCAGQPWWMGGFVWTGFDYRGAYTLPVAEYQFAFRINGYMRISEEYILLLPILVDRQGCSTYLSSLELAGTGRETHSCLG
jgi:beta-galactosidase